MSDETNNETDVQATRPFSALPLEGRVAVVTGAGRGIGRATARLLAEAGADMVVAARSAPELEETAGEVVAAGRTCTIVPADLSREEDCDRVIARALEAHGKIDLLINNAGTARFAPIWELSAEDFDYNFAVNLRGAFFCARAAMRAMIACRSGHIVNVASTSGKKPYPTQGAYCAAKAGLIALTRVMAVELQPYGVRASAVSPGAVETRLAEEIHPGRDRSGWIQPEDVARAILHLLTLPENIATDEIVIRRFLADPV